MRHGWYEKKYDTIKDVKVCRHGINTTKRNEIWQYYQLTEIYLATLIADIQHR